MLKMLFMIFAMGFMLPAERNYRVSADLLQEIFANLRNVGSSLPSVFSSFNDFVKMAGKMLDAAIEEDCEFRCPGGRKPKPNPRHTAKSNGCGVPGLQIPKYVPVSRLENCCDEHDICYGTCNQKQQTCDLKFKECLYQICKSFQKYISDDFLKGCKAVAKTLYTAVTAMGCKCYLDAQEEACLCDERSYNEL